MQISISKKNVLFGFFTFFLSFFLVNSENLLPNAQKYNVGTLRYDVNKSNKLLSIVRVTQCFFSSEIFSARLPADPSWPKIPRRKLVDDLDDIIEPPCVVTLTGTPRKSRSTVRPSNSHQ